MKRWLGAGFGILFFLAGILLELCLSGAVLWAEMEARFYTTQYGAAGLDLNCPLMLSSTETGTVSTVIVNTLEETTMPVITATLSREGEAQRSSQSLVLAPHESRTLVWPVDSSEMVYERLVLVNIVQSAYGESPLRQGTCGVFLFSLFGQKGVQTFYMLLLLSLVCLGLGAMLWLRSQWPLSEAADGAARAWGVVAALATAGVLVALPRWWGLIMLIDVLTLISLMVVFTEFMRFSPYERQ